MQTAAELNAKPAPAATAAPLLAVRNIEVVYDNVILVLRGLSMDVPKGAIVALLGANGAGKSTTLKAISGLLKTEDGEVTRGEIVFEGQALSAAVEEYNRYLTRKLVIGDVRAGDLRLGGRFMTGDPESFLQALHTTFGLRIIQDGPSRILLKSP